MLDVEPTDPRLHWSGAAELQQVAPGWWQAWRLSPAELVTAHSPDLVRTAGTPAGVVVTFRTDARRLELAVDCDPVQAPVDVLVAGELAHRLVPQDGRVVAELPGAETTVEVWLPQFGVTRIGALRLDGAVTSAGTPAGPLVTSAGAPAGPLWVTYGSSITQCRTAAGPSETWPALVARANRWRLRCLGLAGQCLLDPVAVRAVRDCPAQLISLCLGINIYGKSSLTHRTLAGTVSGAIHTIREGHPRTPIVVISPIVSPPREHTVNAAGLTLAAVREQVELAVRTRQGLGDTGLRLIPGPEILGAAEARLLPDGLHPGPEGYALMAARLGPRLSAYAGG